MLSSATAFVALEIAGAAAVAFRVFFRCRQEVSLSVMSPKLGNVIGYGYRAGGLSAPFPPSFRPSCCNVATAAGYGGNTGLPVTASNSQKPVNWT